MGAAVSLLLMGTSLPGAAGARAKSDMRQVLCSGGQVRVLLLDPTNDELLSAVSHFDSLEPGAQQLRNRIFASLDELTDLRHGTGGHLEIRVASFPPTMGVAAINLGRQDAVMVIQHYEYKPTGEAAPIISLRTADGFWFDHYAAEATRMWGNGSPWPLSVGQVVARSPRPRLLDSFGPTLGQALSHAHRLLVTGITRNTFVTSNYATLEGLLRNGCQIRFVLLDPDSAAVAAAANRYYAKRSQGRVAQRTRETMGLLSELSRSTGGPIMLRLTAHPLAMGIIAVEGLPGELAESAALFAEYYSYQASTEPKFILQPRDGQWYTHFLAEGEALWSDAVEFPLVNASPGVCAGDPAQGGKACLANRGVRLSRGSVIASFPASFPRVVPPAARTTGRPACRRRGR